jgi:protein subunit release factor A
MFVISSKSIHRLLHLGAVNANVRQTLLAVKSSRTLSSHKQTIDRLEHQRQLVIRLNREVQSAEVNRSQTNLMIGDLREVEDELLELIRLQDNESDQMQQLIHEECEVLDGKVQQLLNRALDLLTIDTVEHVQEAIVEVEHAVGGLESMLFVQELTDFYLQFAAQNGWRVAARDIQIESGS